MTNNVCNWLMESRKNDPDCIALSDINQSVTYRAYYEKAMGLAEHIIRSGVGKGRPVVIFMEKSVDVPVAFLGVACSGC